MTLRQIDFVGLDRSDLMDLVVVAAGPENQGSLATAEGDDVIRRDLQELLLTPMYSRLYEPFWGHIFDLHAGVPGDGAGPALKELKREWRRLMERDRRVKAETARVTYDDVADEYCFNVESALTGELISVAMRST